MQNLTDPILHDCVRIIDRHPDLSPQYKTRIIVGLAKIDEELQSRVRAEVAAPLPMKVKR